jgi:hypothetical protein
MDHGNIAHDNAGVIRRAAQTLGTMTCISPAEPAWADAAWWSLTMSMFVVGFP